MAQIFLNGMLKEVKPLSNFTFFIKLLLVIMLNRLIAIEYSHAFAKSLYLQLNVVEDEY